jgi:hypothetical protein
MSASAAALVQLRTNQVVRTRAYLLFRRLHSDATRLLPWQSLLAFVHVVHNYRETPTFLQTRRRGNEIDMNSNPLTVPDAPPGGIERRGFRTFSNLR